jgi:hypothetical protein
LAIAYWRLPIVWIVDWRLSIVWIVDWRLSIGAARSARIEPQRPNPQSALHNLRNPQSDISNRQSGDR